MLLGDRRAGAQLVAVVLAVGGVRVEAAVAVKPFAAPLDSAAAAERGVADVSVVARPSARALLPRLECPLGVAPADQRVAVLVAEVHSAGEVEEYVEVRARLPGRVDRALGDVHGPVGV